MPFEIECAFFEPLSQYVKRPNTWRPLCCEKAGLHRELNAGTLVNGFRISPAFQSFQPRGQTKASRLSESSQLRFRAL